MAWSMSNASSPRHLTDDDAVGTHTQAVDQQLPLADGSLAFNVRRPCFQTHDVFLRQLKFGRVLDRDDALILRNVLRQDVQEGRLAGARTTRDQNAETRANRGREQFHHLRGNALQLHQLVGGQRAGAEAADGHRRAIERQRRNDGVDARSVGQTGIDHRRRLIHAASDARHDAVDDLQQVPVVAE